MILFSENNEDNINLSLYMMCKKNPANKKHRARNGRGEENSSQIYSSLSPKYKRISTTTAWNRKLLVTDGKKTQPRAAPFCASKFYRFVPYRDSNQIMVLTFVFVTDRESIRKLLLEKETDEEGGVGMQKHKSSSKTSSNRSSQRTSTKKKQQQQ